MVERIVAALIGSECRGVPGDFSDYARCRREETVTQTSLWWDSDRWEPGPEVAAGSDPGVESWILKREPAAGSGTWERELRPGAGNRELGAATGFRYVENKRDRWQITSLK